MYRAFSEHPKDELQHFSLIFNGKSVSCLWETIGLLSPYLAQLIIDNTNNPNEMREYNFKNMGNEYDDIDFDIFSQILNGEKVLYSESNINQLLNIADHFRFEQLKYSVERYKNYLTVYEENYEVCYDNIDELVLCELYLLDLGSIDFDQAHDNVTKIALFRDTICASERFFDSLSKESFIEQIFSCFVSRPKKNYIYFKLIDELKLQREFVSNALRKLKIETISRYIPIETEVLYIIRYYLETKYDINGFIPINCENPNITEKNYFTFLTKDDFEEFQQLPVQLKDLAKNIYHDDDFSQDLNKLIDESEFLIKNNYEMFKHFSLIGNNPNNCLCKIIANDDVDSLQKEASNPDFCPDFLIKPNVFERIDFINKQNCSLIEYAAFHSSIKCFKYLYMSNALIEGKTLKYAVAGGNVEIIRICEQKLENYFFHQKLLEAAIMFKNYDVFRWIIETHVNLIYEPKEMINFCVSHSCFRCLYYFLQQNQFSLDCAFEGVILSNNANIAYLLSKYVKPYNGRYYREIIFLNNNLSLLKILLNKEFEILYFENYPVNCINRSKFVETVTMILESIKRFNGEKNNYFSIKQKYYNKMIKGLIFVSQRCFHFLEFDFLKNYILPLLNLSKKNILNDLLTEFNNILIESKLNIDIFEKKLNGLNDILNVFLNIKNNDITYEDFTKACCFASVDIISKMYSLPLVEKSRIKDKNSIPLSRAIENNNNDVLKFLLDKEETQICTKNKKFLPIIKLNPKGLSIVLEYFAKKNIKVVISEGTFYYIFYSMESPEKLKLLVDSPAFDITNFVLSDGSTTFMHSCALNSAEFFYFLFFNNDIKINIRDKRGYNALHFTKNPEVAEFLLSTNQKTNINPEKVFHYTNDDIVDSLKSSLNNHIFEMLFSCYKKDIFDESKCFSPVQLSQIFSKACSFGSFNIVKSLLNYNINIEFDDFKENYANIGDPKFDVNSGEIPGIFEAITGNKEEVVKLLVEYPLTSLNVQANLFLRYQSFENTTPLIAAVYLDHEKIVSLLLEKGNLVNINAVCDAGNDGKEVTF